MPILDVLVGYVLHSLLGGDKNGNDILESKNMFFGSAVT